MHRLYSFGFNAFQQTGDKSDLACTNKPQCHTRVKTLLYTSWESAVLLNDTNELVVWGFKPTWFDTFIDASKGKQLTSVFGEPNTLLGFIDTEQRLSIITGSFSLHDCVRQVQQAVYYQSQDTLFVLDTKGQVFQYSGIDANIKERRVLLPLPKVIAVAASQTHVLFLTSSNDAPVYALGSNRFSQLGVDIQQQMTDMPTMIEYFCGLRDASYIACGPFHSAVIMAGDVYTFGWDHEGRLGYGVDKDQDVVRLAVFLDVNDQPIEVSAVKAACGSAHTVVLDDQGGIWTCGSNKYAQLGRVLTDNADYDPFFRRCTLLFDNKVEKAINCFAGRWTTFVFTTII